MTRAIRSLNKGRLAVWWVTHRQEAIRSLQLTALVTLMLMAGHFDYQDQLDAERAARAQVEAQLAAAGDLYGPPLPPTVFVLEARTPRELELRLAEIAGSLDGWRARMRGQR